jgi:hypothetical protein
MCGRVGASALAKRHQLRRDLLSTMVVSKSNPLLHADTPTRRHVSPGRGLADRSFRQEQAEELA